MYTVLQSSITYVFPNRQIILFIYQLIFSIFYKIDDYMSAHFIKSSLDKLNEPVSGIKINEDG